VLPALLRKFHEAKVDKADKVVIWGTGTPRREFLFVDDMADASVFVMSLDDQRAAEHLLNYPKPCFVNVGVGEDCTIKELAETIQDVTGFKGELAFDTSKPDGTLQKLLDVSRLNDLGWSSRINLINGIKETYRWYIKKDEQ
jgi:GDP-L-fucose synthase